MSDLTVHFDSLSPKLLDSEVGGRRRLARRLCGQELGLEASSCQELLGPSHFSVMPTCLINIVFEEVV